MICQRDNNNNNNNDDSNNNNHNHNNVQCVNVMVSRLPISWLTWVYIILTVNLNVTFKSKLQNIGINLKSTAAGVL